MFGQSSPSFAMICPFSYLRWNMNIAVLCSCSSEHCSKSGIELSIDQINFIDDQGKEEETKEQQEHPPASPNKNTAP